MGAITKQHVSNNAHTSVSIWKVKRVLCARVDHVVRQLLETGCRILEAHDVESSGSAITELVTGKRYRAHCGHDPGGYDHVGIYYFKWTGEGFAKQVIDYGPVRQATGCGISFAVADLDGSGRLDIVAPGKDGLYVFENLGQ